MKLLWNKTRAAKDASRDWRWSNFIHSNRAVGAYVEVSVSAEERASWPMSESVVAELQALKPESNVVQFDESILDGTLGVVVEPSHCGWLKIEIVGKPWTRVPGWYLRPANAERWKTGRRKKRKQK